MGKGGKACTLRRGGLQMQWQKKGGGGGGGGLTAGAESVVRSEGRLVSAGCRGTLWKTCFVCVCDHRGTVGVPVEGQGCKGGWVHKGGGFTRAGCQGVGRQGAVQARGGCRQGPAGLCVLEGCQQQNGAWLAPAGLVPRRGMHACAWMLEFGVRLFMFSSIVDCGGGGVESEVGLLRSTNQCHDRQVQQAGGRAEAQPPRPSFCLPYCARRALA